MKIQKIKIKLENIGYYTNLYTNYDLLVVGTKIEISDDGIGTIQNSFGIEIKDNLMIIDYAIGQIPKEEKFSRVSEGIKFIKKTFPIES